MADVAHVGRTGEARRQERWVHQFSSECFGVGFVSIGESPIGFEVQAVDAAPVSLKPRARGECAGLEAGLHALFKSGEFDAIAGAHVKAACRAFGDDVGGQAAFGDDAVNSLRLLDVLAQLGDGLVGGDQCVQRIKSPEWHG